MNGNKARYLEGDSVAYRLHLEGLQDGETYQVTFQWDATHSEQNALDYITSFDKTVEYACETVGISDTDMCDAVRSEEDIPWDTILLDGRPDCGAGETCDGPVQPPISEVESYKMTVWGGSNLHFVEAGVSDFYTYAPNDPPPYDTTNEFKTSVTVEFEANEEDAVLAWGGHISTRMDWGNSNSAINIPGSPYHMRLVLVEDMGESDGEGGTFARGSKDVQLSADAVFFETTINVSKDAGDDDSTEFPFDYSVAASDPNEFSLFGSGKGGTPGLSKTIQVFSDATVEVIEDLSGFANWSLESVECMREGSEDDPSTGVSGGISIDVVEGDIIQCVFTNAFTGKPNLEVIKQVFTDTNTDCTSAIWEAPLSKQVEVQPGDSVKYCYRVTNATSDEIAALNVILVDDNGTPGDTNDDHQIKLFGGDIGDPPPVSVNLGKGSKAYGELIKQIDAQVKSTEKNIAVADADNADPSQDTAQVTLAEDLDCSVTAGVVLQGNDCSGATGILNGVLSNGELDVTWCSEVCWDGSANPGDDYKLQATTVTLLDPNETPNIPEDDFIVQGPVPADPNTLGAGECGTAFFDETLSGDTLRRLLAEGVWGVADEVSESCSDTASVNIFDPQINLDKKVSTDSNCANPQNEITVYYGTEVYYCFSVANNGDEDLDAVRLSDGDLPGFPTDPNTIFSESLVLAASGSWSYQFPASSPGIAITQAMFMNTATVVGTGVISDVQTAPSMDSAKVNTWYVDLEIVKTGTNQLREFGDAWSYSFRVRNLGTGNAENIVLTDDDIAFPTAFSITEPLPAGCSITNNFLTCKVALPLPPYDSSDSSTEVHITINGTYEGNGSDGPFVNEACVVSDQTEVIDTSNDCDTHTTRVSPGATRTIGFWRNHPVLLEACLVDLGDINLGFMVIKDDLVDAQVSTAISSSGKGKKSRKNFVGLDTPVTVDVASDDSGAIEYALGVLKAHTSKFSNGQSRSHLDQARIQASRQVLAAICNNQYLGAEDPEPNWFDTAAAVLAGSDRGAILSLGGKADAYNNAGDSDPLPPYAAELQSNANPAAMDDDPTDPEGVDTDDMPTCSELSDPSGCP
ncbi:MAG: hypothetical protein ABJK25_08270 [Halieaceae bacterium]